MDNTTSQPNMQDLSPDQISANLAFATHLNEQMMPKDMAPMETSQGATSGEGEGSGKSVDEMESRILEEISSLKAEVKASKGGNSEIEDLKRQIEEVLNDNG